MVSLLAAASGPAGSARAEHAAGLTLEAIDEALPRPRPARGHPTLQPVLRPRHEHEVDLLRHEAPPQEAQTPSLGLLAQEPQAHLAVAPPGEHRQRPHAALRHVMRQARHNLSRHSRHGMMFALQRGPVDPNTRIVPGMPATDWALPAVDLGRTAGKLGRDAFRDGCSETPRAQSSPETAPNGIQVDLSG